MVTDLAERELVLQVVRGQRPWADLEAIGVTITRQDNSYVVENRRRVTAVARAEDIAQGLLAYQRDRAALKEWASILLAGAPILDLALEDHPDGDVLLGALWDASLGEP